MDRYVDIKTSDEIEIEQLKIFAKELILQLEKQKNMTCEERIVCYLAAWRDISEVSK